MPKQLTDAEIKAANLAHAKWLQSRVNDSKAVKHYVNFINSSKGKK